MTGCGWPRTSSDTMLSALGNTSIREAGPPRHGRKGTQKSLMILKVRHKEFQLYTGFLDPGILKIKFTRWFTKRTGCLLVGLNDHIQVGFFSLLCHASQVEKRGECLFRLSGQQEDLLADRCRQIPIVDSHFPIQNAAETQDVLYHTRVTARSKRNTVKRPHKSHSCLSFPTARVMKLSIEFY